MMKANRGRACARLMSIWLFALAACDGDDEAPSSDGAATGDPDDGDSADGDTSDGDTADDDETSGVDDTSSDALPIVGEWTETFPGGAGMQTHTITEQTWTMTSELGPSMHHIDMWDVAAQALVAQADEANDFNPGAWGKFEWTWDDSALYYCQIAFDAASAEDAWAAASADPSDLEMGCSGFPWSRLDPAQ